MFIDGEKYAENRVEIISALDELKRTMCDVVTLADRGEPTTFYEEETSCEIRSAMKKIQSLVQYAEIEEVSLLRIDIVAELHILERKLSALIDDLAKINKCLPEPTQESVNKWLPEWAHESVHVAVEHVRMKIMAGIRAMQR